MRTVDRREGTRHAVGGELSAEGGGQPRNYIKIVIVAERVCLYLSDGLFHKARRQRILTQDELVRTLGALETGPGVVARQEADRGFEEVAVENRVVAERSSASP